MTKKVHLFDLPESFIIKLEPEFRINLFKRLLNKIGSKKLAKELGISRSFVYHLKSGRHSVRLKHLKKLCSLSGTSPYLFEKNLSMLISNRGGRAKLKFPITQSPKLASLVGHCFGDASISQKHEFNYVNKDKKMVKKVEKDVYDLFYSKPIHFRHQSDGTTKVAFSTLIGDILILFGAPFGTKVLGSVSIPAWIRKGSKEEKRAFLRALFDDDGSVFYTEKYPSKNVNLHLTRITKKFKNLVTILTQVKEMLFDFGITAHGPYTARKYQVKNLKRVVMGILISKSSERCRFHKSVGFSSKEKNIRLMKCLPTGDRNK